MELAAVFIKTHSISPNQNYLNFGNKLMFEYKIEDE